LTGSGYIESDVLGKLGLLSSEIGSVTTLSSLNLDAENLSGELEDLVLDLAVLSSYVSIVTSER
jgi:hypothetical protein